MKVAAAGSLYQRLADRLTDEIRAGVLAAGTQLPTQRELAADLGTTVGTVGRAYTLLEERGLIVREVGRGTFVGEIDRLELNDTSPAPDLDKAAILARIEELEAQIAELRSIIENS